MQARVAPDPVVVVRRAERVRAVFDHGESVLGGQCVDLLEVAREAAEVHDHDGPRPWPDAGPHRHRVDVAARGIDVGEHGDATLVEEHLVGRDEADRSRDDLGAARQLEQMHCEVERGGARAHGDRV